MAAPSFFRIKVAGDGEEGGKVYELDRLTLGEARILKREFGLADLAHFNSTDPDQLVGLLVLALQRENPALTLKEAIAQVEDLDVEAFEEAPAAEEESDPTPAASGGEAPTEATAGSQETSQDEPGSPS